MNKLWQRYIGFCERKLNFVYPKKLADVTIRTFLKKYIVNYVPFGFALMIFAFFFFSRSGTDNVARLALISVLVSSLVGLTFDIIIVIVAKLWS